MVRFERKYFPARQSRLRLRWVIWGALAVLVFGLVLFLKAAAR
jgi:hypothetical protein